MARVKIYHKQGHGRRFFEEPEGTPFIRENFQYVGILNLPKDESTGVILNIAWRAANTVSKNWWENDVAQTFVGPCRSLSVGDVLEICPNNSDFDSTLWEVAPISFTEIYRPENPNAVAHSLECQDNGVTNAWKEGKI